LNKKALASIVLVVAVALSGLVVGTVFIRGITTDTVGVYGPLHFDGSVTKIGECYNISYILTNEGELSDHSITVQLDEYRFLLDGTALENVTGLTFYLNGTSASFNAPSCSLDYGDSLQANFIVP
jgi:hypothetical protein